MGVFHLLYEVDHAGLSVSHLPVKWQRLQAVITRKRAPCTEVHGAAGLVVAGHCFPPVCPLFVLWEIRERKIEEGQVKGEKRRKRRIKNEGSPIGKTLFPAGCRKCRES